MKDLLQRIGACLLAVIDAEDTPDDIRECAEGLFEEISAEIAKLPQQ